MAFIFNRRRFLKKSATLVAVPALRGLTGVEVALSAEAQGGPQAEGLERAFLEPPDEAWPWVYWFVSDGNLTREGITADFEAMKRVGIHGVLYMEVDQSVPKGPARLLSPMWREMLQHAMKEATRLGITINMNNDGGWCGSGGPWITPELSMQMVVWSEIAVQGPKTFTGTLPHPKTTENYYNDIAVLAIPAPPEEGRRMADSSPQLTYGADRKSFDSAGLTDGNTGTTALLPRAASGQPEPLNIDFAEPFTARALTVALDARGSQMDGVLEVSDDGQDFRPIRSFTLHWPTASVNFPEVAARHYRVTLKTPAGRPGGGGPMGAPLAKGIPLGEVELHACLRIEDIPQKAAYIRLQDSERAHGVASGEPAPTAGACVRRDRVIDISRNMDREGKLTWDAPEGKWTILRLGHTSTGVVNHPAPQESLGLDCDKLSKKAIEVQFAALMGKLLDDQAAIGGSALKMTHIDSWETGSQNWTLGFRDEFQKRCGYDLLSLLPVLTGRVVESREVSERFLWDLRRTVADLLLENYAGHMQEIANQHGLTLSIEAYGGGPLDEVAFGGRADVPMSEFWTGGEYPHTWNKEMASSGHVYGRPVIAAESFTARPDQARWQNHPYRLKPLGDLAFSEGINRFVFHRYSAQPWVDRKPGMTMGPWGIHYERTNTWWEQSRAWLAYLARCQALLQTGQFVADIAYLGTEEAPNSFPARESMQPSLPQGYDFDDLPPEALLTHASVRDGRLVLASGMSYRLLVLPPAATMRPAVLAKLRELVSAGLTVLGPRPSSSPSLADYPHCDNQVQQLGEELWGECDGSGVTENPYGKGKIVWGMPVADVLRALDTPPDFACHQTAVGQQIRYIHRSVGGEEAYFVASGVAEARRFLCTFRVKGKRPELWWPDTGRIEPIVVYDEVRTGTEIPLSLDPYGSVFVVFRSQGAPVADRVVSVRHDSVEISGLTRKPAPEVQLQDELCVVRTNQAGQYSIESAEPGIYELKTAAGHVFKAQVPELLSPLVIEGPWQLAFPKGWGAPEQVRLPRLISWTEHSDPGVKYFSGTATYHRRVEAPEEMMAAARVLSLDLGRVGVIAQVKLNGRDLGILWKPPFRVDVTGILHLGPNDLEVSVVNLWPNRLIGDEQLPPDCEFAALPSFGGMDRGGPLAKYPQWLLDNKPSPAGRFTFTTWKHWTKDDPLQESGLLGPVRIIVHTRVAAV